MKKLMRLFFHDGEVTEIRAHGLSRSSRKKTWEGFAAGGGIVYGYYDDAEAFGLAAAAMDAEQAPGIYFVPNPVNPDLLARAANRLKAAGMKSPLTSDADVVCRRWLLVDLDPKRPAGISSTEDELAAAVALRNRIGKWVKEKWGVAGIPAVSGNGAHLMYRVADLPNDSEHAELFRAVLAGLAAQFGTDQVDVDRTVYNAARIWKLYGTMARKGDHVASRPHRRSELHKSWHGKTLEDVPVLPTEALKEIAALAPAKTQEKGEGVDKGRVEKTPPRASGEVDLGPLDVEKYLTHYSVVYSVKEQAGKTLYRLEKCLFNPAHGRNEASIVQDGGGKLTYQCFHQSCQGRSWSEARQLISGDAKIAQFCPGYNPGKKKKTEKKSPLAPTPQQAQYCADIPAPSRVPPLENLDRGVFLNEKGRVVPMRVVEFMEARLAPIKNDGHQYYRYMPCGVWKAYENDEIRQDIIRVLGPHATANAMNGIHELLRNKVYVHAEHFKHDTTYLNVQNGMINVYTLEMLPHDPKYMSRIQLPVKYDPDAECPTWDRTLAQVFVDNVEKVLALQSYYGYCLLPDCRYQRCLFMIGDGANGKSTVMEILPKVLGDPNVSGLPMQLMSQRFLIGQIKDKLVNLAGEVPSGQLIDTENFKAAVVGNMLTADTKHGQPYTFYPIAKHVFAMNDVPKLADKSFGFMRRPLVLTFKQRFLPGTPQCDPELDKKLETEVEGIFAWMMEGLSGVLMNRALYIPPSVAADTADFAAHSNPLTQFVEECCVVGPSVSVQPKQLFEEYVKWCQDSKLHALGKIRFYQQIAGQVDGVFRKKDDVDRLERFYGVGLKGFF